MKHVGFICLFPLLLSAGNLADLLELASKNKSVEASTYTLDAAKAKESSIKSGYLPSITLGGNATYNEIETMLAPEKSRTGYAKASFTIYDGGKREALFEQQQALVNSASYSLSSTKNNVSLNVIYGYYSYLSTLASKEATLQKLEQLNAERYRLEKFLQVGGATGDEVQKIISSIEQTKVDLLNLDNTLNNTLNTLEYLTGTRVNVEAGSTIRLQEEGSHDTTRLDILALEESVRSSEAEAKAAKSLFLPTVTLEDTYSRFKYQYANHIYDTDQDYQNTVQLGFQWKVFDFGSTASSYESARYAYLSKNSELAYEKNKASASLKSAQNSYKSALAKIEASEARLKASDMTYELVKKKFQQGIVNNVSYLDALSDKYNAQSGLQAARYDAQYQKAVLLYEMGKEIKGAIQ